MFCNMIHQYDTDIQIDTVYLRIEPTAHSNVRQLKPNLPTLPALAAGRHLSVASVEPRLLKRRKRHHGPALLQWLAALGGA